MHVSCGLWAGIHSDESSPLGICIQLKSLQSLSSLGTAKAPEGLQGPKG